MDGSPGPIGPTNGKVQSGRIAASSRTSGMSILEAMIAPMKRIRGCGNAATAASTGPSSSALAKAAVSATLNASWTLSLSVRMRCASSGALARTTSARRAKRSSAARKLASSMPFFAPWSSSM